jgi:hypothetical protein
MKYLLNHLNNLIPSPLSGEGQGMRAKRKINQPVRVGLYNP